MDYKDTIIIKFHCEECPLFEHNTHCPLEHTCKDFEDWKRLSEQAKKTWDIAFKAGEDKANKNWQTKTKKWGVK
jgi:hypothetical protein